MSCLCQYSIIREGFALLILLRINWDEYMFLSKIPLIWISSMLLVCTNNSIGSTKLASITSHHSFMYSLLSLVKFSKMYFNNWGRDARGTGKLGGLTRILLMSKCSNFGNLEWKDLIWACVRTEVRPAKLRDLIFWQCSITSSITSG